VSLRDGRALLVYNHTTGGRTPLNLALSTDGAAWQSACVLEDAAGEYSYPAVIQGGDGRIHLTYTWNRRRVRYVALGENAL
jgi:predicted neuraminidase